MIRLFSRALSIYVLLITISCATAIDQRTLDDRLIVAVKSGNAKEVENLLEKNADPNVMVADGTTALMSASIMGQATIVKMLLDKGADVDMGISDGETALSLASIGELVDAFWYSAYEDVAKFLLAKGADANSALIFVSRTRAPKFINLLLDKGANINTTDSYGNTALIIACKNANREVAKLLVEKGANVNAQNRDGKTALFFASVFQNSIEIVSLLKEKRAK